MLFPFWHIGEYLRDADRIRIVKACHILTHRFAEITAPRQYRQVQKYLIAGAGLADDPINRMQIFFKQLGTSWRPLAGKS